MQKDNKFFEDIARLAGGAAGGLLDMKREIEDMVGRQMEKLLQKMNLVTKEEFEAAKTDLETMKTTWAEATAAASAGHTAEATDKGRIVQAKAEELKNQLGMNELVASAG